MAAMRTAIPGAELQVFAHSRHGLPLSHGRACAEMLAAFLKRATADVIPNLGYCAPSSSVY